MLAKSFAGRIQSLLSSGNGFVPGVCVAADAALWGGESVDDCEALPLHPDTSKGKKMSNPARKRVRYVLTPAR